MSGLFPLSVSELAAAVKGRLEGEFGKVLVQGELCSVKLHSSGHLYCDLKDEGAVLNAVAWRSTVAKWGGQIPKMGDMVVVTGKLTTYPARSQYQLMIDKVELAGLGALMQRLEQLKQRLAEEGLFDQENKTGLPFLPRRIGIVTSPTGAVIGDMLHRLEDRCPRKVTLWPVAVQGEGAAEQIAAAVKGFNNLQGEARPDVLIVARGGGSFEDLMAFNSEVVVRAIAASEIPVISGVGHEPDVTLCDLVADIRAPTPTAAAELVVPVREELLWALQNATQRLSRLMMDVIDDGYARLEQFLRLLPDPRRQLLQATQRLEELEVRLRVCGPAALTRMKERLESLARLVVAHDPVAPLNKGFVYLKRGNEMVRSASANAGAVEIHFKDGVRKGELL